MCLVNTTGLVVPSQDAIYNSMLADESKVVAAGIQGSAVAMFLHEGIKIQAAQFVTFFYFGGLRITQLDTDGRC